MSIAVLGWGSLIWDPRDLDVEHKWHDDGPLLPLEFARVSKGDRLTLVIVKDAPAQNTLWARSKKASIEAAALDLMTREGIESRRAVGLWPVVSPFAPRSSGIAATVGAWATSKGLTGVVWTALGPKCPAGAHRLASGDELISYLCALEKVGRATEARRYVENAPPQIQTPLRQRIRAELRWS